MREGTIAEVLAGSADWTIVHGDALALLRDLPSKSVDLIAADSPYSSGGAFRGDRVQSTTEKYVGNDVQIRGEREGYEGDNRDQRSYAYWMALWLGECLRVAKPGAVACVFTDWRQLPSTTDALQAGGWVWRGVVPWDKTEGVRPQSGRFRAQAEYVVWGSCGPLPARTEVGVLPGYFHGMRTDEDKIHEAGKPIAVMREIVRVGVPGGVVLDPFCGSASTVIGALLEGRRAIGFELSSHWAERGRARVRAEAAGLKLRDVEAGQLGLLGGERP